MGGQKRVCDQSQQHSHVSSEDGTLNPHGLGLGEVIRLECFVKYDASS